MPIRSPAFSRFVPALSQWVLAASTAAALVLASCGLDASGLLTPAETGTAPFDSGNGPPASSGTLGASDSSVEAAVWTDTSDATGDDSGESGGGSGSPTSSGAGSASGSSSGSTSGSDSSGTLAEGGRDDATTARSCTASDCPAVVLYLTSDATAPTGRQITFRVKVLNGMPTGALDLTDVTIRYWFASRGSKNVTFHCDWAVFDCVNVSGRFVTMTAPTPNADTYLELSFKAGSLAAMTDTGDILIRLADTNYAVMFDETRDWSFDATKTTYAAWEHITLYRRGVLAWGIEPQ